MPNELRVSESLTGVNFEDTILGILVHFGLDAHLTGKEGRDIDNIASKTVDEKAYKFYIQCKFWNTTVGMKPIQEAFMSCYYFRNDGTPVMITNNLIACPHCGSATIIKIGKKDGRQRYKCKDCSASFCETYYQRSVWRRRLSSGQSGEPGIYRREYAAVRPAKRKTPGRGLKRPG